MIATVAIVKIPVYYKNVDFYYYHQISLETDIFCNANLQGI